MQAHAPHSLRHALLTAGLAAGITLSGASTSAEPAEPVGHVATLGGSATAQGPGGARDLQCGDPVFAGETLRTSDQGHVGLLMGDALAHVGAGSALRVEEGGDLRLEDGKVRLLDAILGEDRRTLRALDAVASHHGNDTEAYIFTEKTGRYSMHCEWDDPLEIARGDESAVADPGKCIISKSDEPLYPAEAHPERLPIAEGPCGAPIPFGPVADRFLPDVGTSPYLPPPPPPTGQEAPAPDPCDNPGSGCRGTLIAGGPFPPGPAGGPPGGPPTDPPVDPPTTPPVDPPVIEPPPVGGGVPGGPGSP